MAKTKGRDKGCYAEYAIAWTGIFIAAGSGALMGTGYSLLKDDKNNADINNKKSSVILPQQVQKYTLGGIMFMVGLYLASPAWLRQFWMMKFNNNNTE